MSQPVITGFPQSTYVWTARAAFNQKGVAHDFVPIMPPANRAPEHLAKHPWGKVPVLDHGDLRLYETTAICAYLDAAFDGPALTPSDPAELARMHQIVSIANAYLYPTAVPRYILQYIFPSGPDGAPNREVIDAALPEVRKTLEVLDAELGAGDWFVGQSPTLADFFVGPLLFSISAFPGGPELLDGLNNLGRLKAKLASEPNFMAAAPQT